MINQTITLTIHGIGSEGEGVGYHNGYTVFVDGALPGEIIEAHLFEKHKRYGKARLVQILKHSPERVEPPCKLFGTCGGCQLMHLSYPKQLEVKRQRIIDALVRIGKMDGTLVAPCLPSPSSLAYRNKIQLPVRKGGNGLLIGLYARGSHDLVEVEICHIHSPLGEAVYKEVRSILLQSKIEAYDPATQEGELRHVLIKSTLHTNEAFVILVTGKKISTELEQIAAKIMASHPAIKGVVHNLHTGKENVILGTGYQVLTGASSMQEKLCGLTFKVSPASFFQVNPAQAEHLYSKALAFAELSGRETVLDAYCGVGTLSLLFAKHASKVIGVESVPQAIQDAHENAKLNSIHNVTFVCSPCETFIPSLSAIDIALINPPRKGCDPTFLDGIGRLLPKKLIYISCNPATLARDLAYLVQFGYKVRAVQPYDMFAQTAHVECVVQLMLEQKQSPSLPNVPRKARG